MKRTLLALFASALLVFSPVYGADNNIFVTTKTMAPLVRSVRHDNHMHLRVPKSKQFFTVAEDLNLDIWSVGKTSVELRADAQQKRELERRLKVTAQVLNSNIQASIDRETAQLNEQIKVGRKFAVGDDTWHTQYHTFDDIVTWYKGVAAKYPTMVKFKPSIGKTFQGKDLPLLEITGTSGTNKKNIWFHGQQHAREWISGATVQYIVDKLTSGYGSDQRITSIMNNVKFIVVPVMNPDGYEYTWQTDRMWRKNRNGQGVDLNRNWPDHWSDTGGASTNPGSDTYKGKSAASEPEVKALIAAYQSYPDGMVGAIDFHSYSQLILRPYGWTTQTSPDEAAFASLGESMKKDIAASRGTEYVSENGIDLYKTTGTASDYFYGSSTTRKGQFRSYGITIELSPDANDVDYGFELPPKFIIPVGTEILPAVLTYSEFCVSKPLTS